MSLNFADFYSKDYYFASILFIKENERSRIVDGRLNDEAFIQMCRTELTNGCLVHGVSLNGHAVTHLWRKSMYDHSKIVTWLRRNARYHKPDFFIIGGYIDKADGTKEFCINGMRVPLVFAKKPWCITQSIYRLEFPNIAVRVSSGHCSSPEKYLLDESCVAKITACIQNGDAIWR